MENMQDFFIYDGSLENYHGPGGDVVIPVFAKKIGRHAFEGCTALASVTFPKRGKEIDGGAFHGDAVEYDVVVTNKVLNLTIHAPAGSVAERYANRCSIKFEVTE